MPALIVAGVFVVGFIALVVWIYRRIYSPTWFAREAAARGWTVIPNPTEESLTTTDWEWLRWFREVFGSVRVRAAAAIHTGDLEQAFLLRMGTFGMSRGLGSAYPQRGVWIGVIGRLPRPIDAGILFLPYRGSLGEALISLFSGRRAVELGHDVLDRTWAAYTEEPERAAEALARDPQLRAALVALSPVGKLFAAKVPEAAVAGTPRLRHLHLMFELRGDRFAILTDAGEFVPGAGRLEHLEEAGRGFVATLGG